MPARWTSIQKRQKRKELEYLYIEKKKTIFEVAQELGISWQPEPSFALAEFTGIMLGDGQIEPRNSQARITINTITDKGYIQYVANLVENLFKTYVSYSWRESTVTVFITSVELLEKLKNIGLSSSNKVKTQVDIPSYKLRFGTQMALTNRSWPLLRSSRKILKQFNFHPSKISCFKIYLTKSGDLKRYFGEIGSGNPKHLIRAKKFGIIRDAPGWRSSYRTAL